MLLCILIKGLNSVLKGPKGINQRYAYLLLVYCTETSHKVFLKPITATAKKSIGTFNKIQIVGRMDGQCQNTGGW